MTPYELEEVLVVLLSYTLSNPNAMMIKPRYAYVAYPTVLGSRGFYEVTCRTLSVREVHDIVIVGLKLLNILTYVLLVDYSSRVMAGLVVGVEGIHC
jgi:hypothetical protein